MKKPLKNLVLCLLALCLPLVLGGCAETMGENIAKAGNDDAVSIVQVDTYIDGAQANSFGASCYPTFSLVGQKDYLNYRRMDPNFIVLRSPPGKIQLTSLFCSEYKVLYNKMRTHQFKDGVSFQAAPGYVNYAGKLKINYRMSSFGAGDFFGTGEQESEGFHVQMKLLDDYQGAQREFLKRYKELPPGFTFKKSLFGRNELFD